MPLSSVPRAQPGRLSAGFVDDVTVCDPHDDHLRGIIVDGGGQLFERGLATSMRILGHRAETTSAALGVDRSQVVGEPRQRVLVRRDAVVQCGGL